MDVVRESRPRPWGYVIVLLGAVLFAVACFLPYYSLENGPGGAPYGPSLYTIQTVDDSGFGDPGGILILFSGVATSRSPRCSGSSDHRDGPPSR
jgi:hypothetical protein